MTLHHFGAFLDAGWRENDYLWGRLDAAELILRTLHEGRTSTPQEPGSEPAPTTVQTALSAAGGHHLIDALRSVLATEKNLMRVSTLRSDLEDEITALAQSLPEGSGGQDPLIPALG